TASPERRRSRRSGSFLPPVRSRSPGRYRLPSAIPSARAATASTQASTWSRPPAPPFRRQRPAALRSPDSHAAAGANWSSSSTAPASARSPRISLRSTSTAAPLSSPASVSASSAPRATRAGRTSTSRSASAARRSTRAAPCPDAQPPPPVVPSEGVEKRYLMTPGPTPAPPEVLAAIAQPVIHHRGPDYKKLYAEVLARLREVFRTDSEVLLFGASGTGAMESAVANLCSPGEPVLVVSAGYFGERWAKL